MEPTKLKKQESKLMKKESDMEKKVMDKMEAEEVPAVLPKKEGSCGTKKEADMVPEVEPQMEQEGEEEMMPASEEEITIDVSSDDEEEEEGEEMEMGDEEDQTVSYEEQMPPEDQKSMTTEQDAEEEMPPEEEKPMTTEQDEAPCGMCGEMPCACPSVEEQEGEQEIKLPEAELPVDDTVKKVMEKVSNELPKASVTKKPELTIEQLIADDKTLTEDFKSKAMVLFEAAVAEKVAGKVELIKEKCESVIRSELKSHYGFVVEKIDGYLTYAIESMIQDKEESVDDRLRSEIAESFIQSLKNVFESHYIEMPKGKVDAYADLSTKAKDLTEKCNKQSLTIKSLNKEVVKLQRERVINEHSKGLYDTQIEKLKKLTENLEFSDAASFSKKVAIIKETYFKQVNNGKSEIAESKPSHVEVRTKIEEESEAIDSTSVMGKYVQAIAKHMKK